MRLIAIAILCWIQAGLGVTLAKSKTGSNLSTPAIYTGICGASAAAPVGTNWFVVADDEANQLRLYRRDQAGGSIRVFDFTTQLQLDRRSPEVDIEGAAQIGRRIFWISSHSRNQEGKVHPNRYRFFATDVDETNATVTMSFSGRPYQTLLQDLIAAPSLQRFNLQAASRLPPKAPGGLNIEGLCATPDKRLLIAFRNPLPQGLALLVPLENPDEVIAGRRARVGEPILLDLNGLGIRDIACWEGEYILVAGPHDGGGKSRLFRWDGVSDKPKQLKEVDLKGLNPEAVVIYPDGGLASIQLLSDDSNRGKVECKDLKPSARHFRSVWVVLKHEPGSVSRR